MIFPPHHSPPPPEAASRPRRVVGRTANGQPRTYRLPPLDPRQTAYRRLVVAIVGLDIATLADELRLRRRPAMPRAA